MRNGTKKKSSLWARSTTPAPKRRGRPRAIAGPSRGKGSICFARIESRRPRPDDLSTTPHERQSLTARAATSAAFIKSRPSATDARAAMAIFSAKKCRSGAPRPHCGGARHYCPGSRSPRRLHRDDGRSEAVRIPRFATCAGKACRMDKAVAACFRGAKRRENIRHADPVVLAQNPSAPFTPSPSAPAADARKD